MSNEITVGLVIGATLAGSVKTAVGSARAALDQLGSATKVLSAHQRLLGRSLQQAMKRPGSEIANLQSKYERLGRTLQNLKTKSDALSASMKRGATLSEARERSRGQAIEAAGAAVAVAAPVVSAVRAATGFEDQMRDIAITGGFSAQQEASLGAAVREAARTFNQTTQEVQKGLSVLVAGGIGQAQQLAAYAPQLARAATATRASMDDLGAVAIALKDNLQVGEDGFEGALNMLAAAGKRGQFEIRDMAKWLPSLSPHFAALGMTGREAVAEMGAALQIARRGAGTNDEAANNFRNFLAKITAPDTLKDFERAGIDLKVRMRELVDTGMSPLQAMLHLITQYMQSKGPQAVAQLQQVMAINNEAERSAALQQLSQAYKLGELFQDQQAMAFIRPAIANASEMSDIGRDAMAAASQDVIGQDFTLRTAAAGEQMKAFRIAVADLGLSIGSALLPPLTSFMQTLRPWADALAGFAAAHQGLVRGLVGVGAAIVGVTAGAAVLKYGFLLAAGAGSALKTAWLASSAAGAVLKAVASSGLGLVPALRMLGLNAAQARATAAAYRTATVAAAGFGRTALWAATHPLAALKAATAATLAYASALHTRLAASTRVAMLASVNWARVLGTSLVAGLKAAGAAAWALARAMLMNPIGLAVTAIAAGALLIYRHWGTVKAFFSGLWSGMKAGIHAARAALAPAMAQMRQSWLALKAAIAPLMPVLRLVFAPVIVPLRLVVSGVQTLVGWVRQLFTPTQAAAGAAARLGQSWGAGIGQAIGAIARLVGQALELPARFAQMGADMVGGLVRGIQSQLGAAREAIVGMGLSIKGWFADTLGIRSPSRVFIELGHNVGEGAAIGIARSAQLGVEAAQHMGRQIAAVPLTEADSPLLRPTSSKAVLGRGGGSVQTPDMPLGQKSTGGGALGVK